MSQNNIVIRLGLSLGIFCFWLSSINAQKEVRSFIFGHSLINHEVQVNPTPSQETSIPHWMHFLAEAGGNTYAVSGQYGFLPQHANVPPIAQWGFDFATGAWESDYEPFSAANFTNILITPANFIQWQGPEENYFGEIISPIDATKTIVDWCIEQESTLEFFVYENWPDMAPFLNNGFPPSEDEWADYLAYLNGDFHDWFLEYYYAIAEAYPNSCVKMIPVGPVINSLLTFEPFNQIPIEELYEDDAPHGRSTIYFLGALATYMAMYAEKPPSNFEVDAIIHPIIQQNLDNAIEYIFSRLIDFTDQDGKNIAFCSDTPASTNFTQKDGQQAIVYPNPTHGDLTIEGLEKGANVELFRVDGTIVLKERKTLSGPYSINLQGYPNGLYQLIVRDNTYHIVFDKKIYKIVD